jgi:hypothetical protein
MLRRVVRAAQRGGGGGHGHGDAHGPARLFGEPVSQALPSSGAARKARAIVDGEVGMLFPAEARRATHSPLRYTRSPSFILQALAQGQARKPEQWELSYGVAFAGAGLIAVLSLGSPNTDPHDWARDEAEERMRR